MVFSSRLKRLTDYISEDSGVLINSEVNRFYFTGFKSSFGYLLVTKGAVKFFTDSRYAVDAYVNIPESIEVEIVDSTSCYSLIASAIKKEGIKSLGIEESYLTAREAKVIRSNFNAQLKIYDISPIISSMRAIKSKDELGAMKLSASICDTVFSIILKRIKYNMSEIDLAIEIEHQLRLAGADGIAFDTICAFGVNSSKPHAHPTPNKLEKGDMILLDFGCVKNGYCSDFSRTLAFFQIKPELKRIYNIVLGAQRHALNAIKAGMNTREADSFAREFIKANGYGDEFTHALGHGVGLEIHEAPTVSKNSDDVLKNNMTVSCEPGIYLNGIGGVRIEDVIIVEDDKVTPLTSSTKELIIL